MDHPVVENLYELVVWPKGTQPHILDIGANIGYWTKNVKSIWVKSSLNFFLKYTLFFSALLSRSKPFQFVRNNTVKMLSQVITNNGKIIIKRDTYLQIVTQCNICTNVKVFFCALRKIHKQTVQGLKKHLLSGNNVHCSKNEKVKKCLHSLSLFF